MTKLQTLEERLRQSSSALERARHERVLARAAKPTVRGLSSLFENIKTLWESATPKEQAELLPLLVTRVVTEEKTRAHGSFLTDFSVFLPKNLTHEPTMGG